MLHLIVHFNLKGFFSRYGSDATPFDDQKAEDESEDLLSAISTVRSALFLYLV